MTLSIIIPVCNEHEWTRECVLAIERHTPHCEIVLVDNGSSPPAADVIPAITGRHLRNEVNLGFPVAVNQGVRAALGDVICLLNNDCIVTPGWSERLMQLLDEFAIVGPMTSFAAGVQLTGAPVYYDTEDLDRVAAEWMKGRAGRKLCVNWITGFCFMFRRGLYDELGKFDESIWPCSGEEIDFCLRARAAGHRVGIAQDVYVHHEGSQTFRSQINEEYKAIIERNNKHLAERWQMDIWQNQLLPATNGDGIRLNLGCGKFKLKGFTNIDLLDRVEPDLKADICHLPYDAGTVDEIYAGHVLEHFPFSAGMHALHYWHSLLRDGGRISISVPDYDVLARRYVENPGAEQLQELNDIYIYSEHQESHHHYMYSGPLLEKVMREVGFSDLVRMPQDHPYFPMAVDWQIGITAEKHCYKRMGVV